MAAPPRPASTVVLLRPSPRGVEVFMVRRHDDIAFMGGAHVFPGGRVDAGDRLEDPGRLCDGVDAAVARLSDVGREDAVAFHVAAIRELFEEAGVLLARDRSGAMLPVGPDRAGRYRAYRDSVTAGSLWLADLAAREELRLAFDALALFAHWVTPDVETRRFDTRFFAAVAPEEQEAAHDEHENTHGAWMTPGEAIDHCRRGLIALPPPTWTTLRALADFSDVAAVMRWARSRPVPRVQPRILVRDGARVVMLPGDPGCPAVPDFAASETRFLLENGRWTPVAPE